MDRPNTRWLLMFLLVAWAGLTGITLVKGGVFYLGKHEGDALHLLEILFRMYAGDVPHLDFMTPIGGFAFAPIVAMMHAGLGVGTAILVAQSALGLVFGLAALRVAASRLTPPMAFFFVGLVLVLCMALIHGQAEQSISISMHYNRWAWAAAFLAILAALLAPRRQAVILDGLIIGLALAFLAMTKATYFVAFFLPVALALALRKEWATAGVAALASVLVIAAISISYGVGYWAAYIGDLATVAISDVRAKPGVSFKQVVSAPAYVAGSILLVVSVIALRQAGRATEGVILLLLVPGFFYVTYQNFGNDPQWLFFLAVLLLTSKPEDGAKGAFGWDLSRGLPFLGALALA
ncbi:MAG: hypothetical protein AAFY03_13295, partial [Pseudomonadota bacterium]